MSAETKLNTIFMSFNGGTTFQDVSAFVRPDSINVQIKAGNDSFHYDQNTANFELIYDATLFTNIRNATQDLIVIIAHDLNLLGTEGSTLGSAHLGGVTLSDLTPIAPYVDFRGHGKPMIRRDYNGIVENTIISLEFTDSIDLLDIESGDIAYKNHKICDDFNPTNSILHKLYTIAGLTPSTYIKPETVIDITIPIFAPATEDTSIRELVDVLLHEFGYVLAHDEYDRFYAVKWLLANGTSTTHTFGETEVLDPLQESNNPRDYEGVETTYYEITKGVTTDGSSDILVYSDANIPWNDINTNAPGFTLNPGMYYPVLVNTTDETTGQPMVVYQDYTDTGIKYFTNKAIKNKLDFNFRAFDSDFSSIVLTENHRLAWLADSDIVVTTEEYFNRKARIVLKNNGVVNRTLKYLRIFATVWYRTAARVSKKSDGVVKRKVYKYEAQFITTKTYADAYTSGLVDHFKSGNRTYTVGSVQRHSVGQFVRVTLNDGTNDTCRIISRDYDEAEQKFFYTLRKYIPNAAAITSQTNSIPSSEGGAMPSAFSGGRYLGALTAAPSVYSNNDYFFYVGTTVGGFTKGRVYASVLGLWVESNNSVHWNNALNDAVAYNKTVTPAEASPVANAFLSALTGSSLSLYNQTNETPVDGDLKQVSTAGGINFYKRVSGAWQQTGGFNGDNLVLEPGDDLISIGFDTTPITSDASMSVAIGTGAGKYLRDGVATNNRCIFIGTNAGRGQFDTNGGVYNTGYVNICIGQDAGTSLTSGFVNVFMGVGAGLRNTTGHNNIYIGAQAGAFTTTGAFNTGIGELAGATNTTGNFNVYIGENARGQSTADYQIAIGVDSLSAGAGVCQIGDNNITTVYRGNKTNANFNTTSDPRTKEDIEYADLSICYSTIKSLPLRRYKYRDFIDPNKKDKHVTGFLSTEFKQAFPKSISTYDVEYDEVDENGNIIYEDEEKTKPKKIKIEQCESINIQEVLPTLFGAVQKLMEKVETLEGVINDLQSKS